MVDVDTEYGQCKNRSLLLEVQFIIVQIANVSSTNECKFYSAVGISMCYGNLRWC